MLSSIILLPSSFPFYLVLRTIGIPTRAISNFNSAHDTDANCTYDRYYDENGEYLAHLSRDSTWWEFNRFCLIKNIHFGLPFILLELDFSELVGVPDIYLFKVNNENTKAMCEICSKTGVIDVVLVSLLLTLNMFQVFICCFHCRLWTSKCWFGKFWLLFAFLIYCKNRKGA